MLLSSGEGKERRRGGEEERGKGQEEDEGKMEKEKWEGDRNNERGERDMG